MHFIPLCDWTCNKSFHNTPWVNNADIASWKEGKLWEEEGARKDQGGVRKEEELGKEEELKREEQLVNKEDLRGRPWAWLRCWGICLDWEYISHWSSPQTSHLVILLSYSWGLSPQGWIKSPLPVLFRTDSFKTHRQFQKSILVIDSFGPNRCGKYELKSFGILGFSPHTQLSLL